MRADVVIYLSRTVSSPSDGCPVAPDAICRDRAVPSLDVGWTRWLETFRGSPIDQLPLDLMVSSVIRSRGTSGSCATSAALKIIS